jgi:hypothetical protein
MITQYLDPASFTVHGNLCGPNSYWEAPGEKRARNCNGCGTEGWKGTLVPDTIWLLRITACCDIHDWMYSEGTTAADKAFADLVFLTNMISLVQSDRSLLGRVLKLLRERRAFTYWQAVTESSVGLAAFKESVLL